MPQVAPQTERKGKSGGDEKEKQEGIKAQIEERNFRGIVRLVGVKSWGDSSMSSRQYR